jgi:hypothetical protein
MKKLTLTPTTALVILAVLSASVALAGDFKTIKGKEYKDATVSRVEPDGIVVRTKVGISKIYFAELPREIQERFHYDPAKATQFNAAVQNGIAQSNAKAQQEAKAQERAAARKAKQLRVMEQQAPIYYGAPPVSFMQSTGGG